MAERFRHRSGRRTPGDRLIVPLIFSAAIAACSVFAIAEPGADDQKDVGRVKADMRALGTAIESYFVDNLVFPAHTFAIGESIHSSLNTGADSPISKIPTFRRRLDDADQLATLTTPLRYITGIFRDPFSPVEGAKLAYYAVRNPKAEGERGGWILWSAGPNRDYDLNSENIQNIFDPFKEYDEGDQRSSPSPALISKTYDPTNGAVSSGDVWRVAGGRRTLGE